MWTILLHLKWPRSLGDCDPFCNQHVAGFSGRGKRSAFARAGDSFMPRFLQAALLGAALIAPLAVAPPSLRAEDDHDRRARNYHDEKHNDDHEWNSHEDRAYRMWAKENHRKYQDFAKLRRDDQESYWGWRHEHSDAALHIDIR
jgi:hypothetical protein